MEIICEILRAIQDGSARPTQVMHKANLTWPVLMTHLAVLLRHQLLTRESSESRTTYRLTARGSAVLNIYLKLKEEVGPLESETILVQRLEEEPPVPALAPRERSLALSAIQSALGGANFRLRDGTVPGKSGSKYRFSLLAEGLSKSSHAFDLLGSVTEGAVIGVCVKQIDSDIPVHIVYSKGVSDGARKLAGSYSIELVPVRGLKGFVELLAFRDALSSKRGVLLEVDPSQDYAPAIRELVQDETKRSRVAAFTWKGSPVYPVLPRNDMVYVYLMSTAQGTKHAPARPREFAVPSYDEAAMLEFLQESVRRDDRGDLVIFDSISDVVVALGSEKAYRFLKRATHALGAGERRSLFIVKRGYHDERTMRTIRDLFEDRLVYDGSGLRLDKRA